MIKLCVTLVLCVVLASLHHPLPPSSTFNLTMNPHKKLLIIVAGFRTGSTFIGNLFNQNPQLHYIFEPFHTGHIKTLVRRGDIVGATSAHSLRGMG